jgi:hypothetical protein
MDQPNPNTEPHSAQSQEILLASPKPNQIAKTVDLEEIPYSDPVPSSPLINHSSDNSSSLAIIPYMAPHNLPQENKDGIDEREIESPPVIQTPHTDLSQDLTRQSARLKRKHPVQYIIGTLVSAPHQNRISLLRAGIDSLINDFPYA